MGGNLLGIEVRHSKDTATRWEDNVLTLAMLDTFGHP